MQLKPNQIWMCTMFLCYARVIVKSMLMQRDGGSVLPHNCSYFLCFFVLQDPFKMASIRATEYPNYLNRVLVWGFCNNRHVQYLAAKAVKDYGQRITHVNLMSIFVDDPIQANCSTEPKLPEKRKRKIPSWHRIKYTHNLLLKWIYNWSKT